MFFASAYKAKTKSHADFFSVFHCMQCNYNQRNNLSHVDFLSTVKLRQQRELLEPAAQDEDREEEISGAQFLCETVIRSLTLEEAPDHRPLRRSQQSTRKANGECHQAPPESM